MKKVKMAKRYVLIYIDPENPEDLAEGDTEIVGIGSLADVVKSVTGEYNHLDDAEDTRIPHHVIFDLSTGKKVKFIFPKPQIKILP